jgi:hypothetical protein
LVYYFSELSTLQADRLLYQSLYSLFFKEEDKKPKPKSKKKREEMRNHVLSSVNGQCGDVCFLLNITECYKHLLNITATRIPK